MGAMPHPLMLQLAEPRRLGLNVREGMWLRLIDLPRRARGAVVCARLGR